MVVNYYDLRISIFYGVDPLVEETGTSYLYCYQNPVRFVDPTGMEGDQPFTSQDLQGSAQKQIHSLLNIMSQEIDNFDLSYVAVGIQKTIGIDTETPIKFESSLIDGSVIFLRGDDAGFVYTYAGYEGGFGIESSFGINANRSTSIFLAYNQTKTGDHKTFDGKYSFSKISLTAESGAITAGVNLSIGYSISKSTGSDWTVYSISKDLGIGYSHGTVITPGYSQGGGYVKIIDSIGEKTKLEKILSYGSLFRKF